jgi:hypothetical protein
MNADFSNLKHPYTIEKIIEFHNKYEMTIKCEDGSRIVLTFNESDISRR